MFSRFFIDRPIFAAVLSILITLGGFLSIFKLPLAQFPRVTPPTVQVQCTYPGASARDVAEAVATPIEQEVDGVEGMMYMSSQSTNDGQYNLTVTFFQGVDLDMAQVLVQNRVNLAIPKLPDVIKATGVTTRKRSPDILMGYAIISPNGRYNQLYLSNYALRAVRDELARLPGVSDVFLFGQMDYSMRVWLDPERMATRNVAASDVVQAIRAQNLPVAAGQVGQQPVPAGQTKQITIDVLGRLSDVEQYENIVLRVTPDGRMLRIRDIGRVTLGAKNEDVVTRFDGRGNIFVAIFQAPDANALDTAELVRAKMEDLKRDFPEDIDYETAFDTTPYTRESIHEVFNTLRDAVLLVAFVVLLFLQNWRSALIPLIAVPVAIVGTFAVMLAIGFSLNNLTLFGLVLAIGIVVDDAIVVVEAVEHHIDHGLQPREATIRAMEQVSGPVIAVGLVLSAVFLPCAFVGGITGLFFRQFALTIAASTIISAFNSLTLSPALTALLLRPRGETNAPPPPLPRLAFALGGGVLAWLFGTARLEKWLAGSSEMLVQASVIGMILAAILAGWLLAPIANRLLGRAFRGFNRGFAWTTNGYLRLIAGMLRHRIVVLGAYALLLGLTYGVFASTPHGFIPGQDMGYLLISVQLPDSAARERTDAVMARISDIARAQPGIRHATAISGQSFVLSANGSNFGSMFVNLHDYKDRRDPSLHSDAIAANLRKQFAGIQDASVAVFSPPPVRGVGRAGGFTLILEDRSDVGPRRLQEQSDNLVNKGRELSGITGLFSVFRANVPEIKVTPNLRECARKGVTLGQFADTLSVLQGSLYVNDFNLLGRTYQVIVQADADYRDQIEDMNRLRVRNSRGQMVPLSSLATIKLDNGPLLLIRYNMYPAVTVNGTAIPEMSSGDVMALMEQLADRELPRTMAYEWSDMSYLELLAGNTAMMLFALAIVMVFLVLAAQYESWSLPLAVILVVPLCLLSALTGVNIAQMDINIFTQIGFVVLVGLASKNAILIVEYAKWQREVGRSREEAALGACKLRLRPIIMTSLAFIFGVLPLVIARGAGAEMRRPLGTAVFSGMIGVTLFGIFLTPTFFYVVDEFGQIWAWTAPGLRRANRQFLRGLNFAGLFLLTGGLSVLVPLLRRSVSAADRRAPNDPK